MKKVVLNFICIVFFGITSLFSQEINVEESIINYGKITKGSNGKREFIIENTGDKPLIITNVQTTCGCTVAEKPTKPILPHKTFNLVVSYDTQRVGPIEKAIIVESNSKIKSRYTLRIKGEVVE
jgi:hypothetical protein